MTMYESIQDKLVQSARKDHKCVWCGEVIPQGSAYRYRVYRFDGDFQTDHTHPECHVAMMDSDDLSEGFFPYEQYRGKSMEETQEIMDSWHECPDWDYMDIDLRSPEFKCCTCPEYKWERENLL